MSGVLSPGELCGQIPVGRERSAGREPKEARMRRLIVVPLTVIATTLFTALFALPVTLAGTGTGAHAAITISSNADFSACGCVTSGDGTAANPFVIGPWALSAPSGGPTPRSAKMAKSA